MSDDYHFDIMQDGVFAAGASGADLDSVRREMLHYAAVYLQDGPIEIVCSPELAPYSRYCRSGSISRITTASTCNCSLICFSSTSSLWRKS